VKKLKLKLPKFIWPKSNPSEGRAQKTARKLFGFEKCDKEKYLKSPSLDEEAVAVALVKLETDLNWVKRLLWLVVAGGIGTHFVP